MENTWRPISAGSNLLSLSPLLMLGSGHHSEVFGEEPDDGSDPVWANLLSLMELHSIQLQVKAIHHLTASFMEVLVTGPTHRTSWQMGPMF